MRQPDWRCAAPCPCEACQEAVSRPNHTLSRVPPLFLLSFSLRKQPGRPERSSHCALRCSPSSTMRLSCHAYRLRRARTARQHCTFAPNSERPTATTVQQVLEKALTCLRSAAPSAQGRRSQRPLLVLLHSFAFHRCTGLFRHRTYDKLSRMRNFFFLCGRPTVVHRRRTSSRPTSMPSPLAALAVYNCACVSLFAPRMKTIHDHS